MDYNEEVSQVCQLASSSKTISRTQVNMIARAFHLLNQVVAAKVRALDDAIVRGSIRILEDGAPVMEHPKRR